MSTIYTHAASTFVPSDVTPQSAPIPGSTQVPNSAGGYAWQLTDEQRLDRFLVLGSEGGTYYVGERALTLANANVVLRCVQADGIGTVRRIVEVSEAGRAPKNDPALFALAIAATKGDDKTRSAALAALPRVARTGTHLFTFVDNAEAMGKGWGRGMKRAVGNWYLERSPDALAYQLCKYQQRGGRSHRDLLRQAHPAAAPGSAHEAAFRWTVSRHVALPDGLPELIQGFTKAQAATTVPEIVGLIATYPRLTWEMIPTELLGHAEVWGALLPNLPLTALVRNLGRMTANGLLAPLSAAARIVADRLADGERLRKERVHPLAVLGALATYREGHGARGKLTWEPVSQVTDALDGAFYRAFANVEPSGKRTLLALDVSGSMTCDQIGGLPGVTPRVGSAAMALITARVEPQHAFMAFSGDFVPLDISPRQRLDDVIATMDRMPFAGTDCSLPMTWALKAKAEIDTFVVYTDNETWEGPIHPSQALAKYRRETGIAAKLVVVGMTATEFTIADPDDGGMLDVVGFDTAAPSLIADFART